jgi:hypothetical protein
MDGLAIRVLVEQKKAVKGLASNVCNHSGFRPLTFDGIFGTGACQAFLRGVVA